MLPYFLSWAYIAALSIGRSRRVSRTSFVLMLIFLTIFIGCRLQVGGDWGSYLGYLYRAVGLSAVNVFQTVEPGYTFLNWLVVNNGGNIVGVNLLCGLVFSTGLLVFCCAQPLPWLALTLAFPYLITVVAMGYSRQGVAIGLELLALLSLERDRIPQFLAWIALAASFHRTVLVLLVLPASTISASLRFSQLIRFSFLAISAYGLYSSLIAPELDYYISGYLNSQIQSQGAFIRVALCFFPAIVFLLFRSTFHLPPLTNRIWSLLSLMAIASAIALFSGVSSTVVDRLALYLIPLQIFVGSRIPDARLFGINSNSWNILLILLSLLVLFVWLFFAGNSQFWIPYRNSILPF